jgi:hypothetical protein
MYRPHFATLASSTCCAILQSGDVFIMRMLRIILLGVTLVALGAGAVAAQDTVRIGNLNDPASSTAISASRTWWFRASRPRAPTAAAC